MKSPTFDCVRAQHLDQVFGWLAEYGDEARILAGGQTLLATLNMRLSEPGILIDISALDELKGIEIVADTIRIGALVTHSEIEDSRLIAQHLPLLHQAVPYIAHRAIRNRGTWGGSIAYADPAAEWPACALALDGVVVLSSRAGVRRVAARDFFVSLYTTALEAGEIVIATEFNRFGAGQVCLFQELARRHGDYAIAGLAASATRKGSVFTNVRLAYLGVGIVPVRVERTEGLLEGRSLSEELIEESCILLRTELSGALEPIADLTHSAALKRQLAAVLLDRTLKTFARGGAPSE